MMRTRPILLGPIVAFVLVPFVFLPFGSSTAAAQSGPPQFEALIQRCQDFARAGHASAKAYSDVARHKKAMAAICLEWEKLAQLRLDERRAQAENLRRLCTREAMAGRELGAASRTNELTPHKEQGIAICDQLFEAVTK